MKTFLAKVFDFIFSIPLFYSETAKGLSTMMLTFLILGYGPSSWTGLGKFLGVWMAAWWLLDWFTQATFEAAISLMVSLQSNETPVDK